jgi:hypothetical protein
MTRTIRRQGKVQRFESATPRAEDMVHPAVLEAAEHHGMAPDPWEEQAVAEHFGQPAEPPHLREIDPENARRDLAIALRMAAAERGEMSYDHGTGEGATPMLEGINRGPGKSEAFLDGLRAGGMYYDQGTGEGATPMMDGVNKYRDARAQERTARTQKVADAYQYGQGYLNNPLDGKGRGRMGTQFWEAPLGGHVRAGLDGQEIFGHTIDRDQALMAERGLAGLLATGVGVPAFMAAVQQLTTPADQNTIPL